MTTQSKVMNANCPHCGAWLYGIHYPRDGSRTADSAPLVENEHGMYSIRKNEKCRRKVRMVQAAPDIWVIAPQQPPE